MRVKLHALQAAQHALATEAGWNMQARRPAGRAHELSSGMILATMSAVFMARFTSLQGAPAALHAAQTASARPQHDLHLDQRAPALGRAAGPACSGWQGAHARL